MERVVSVNGSFRAKVLAARLESEGIDVELRGALDSPYAFTVGDLSRVDVYVGSDDVDDARLVLLAAEVDDATDLEPASPAFHPFNWRAVALIAMAIVIFLGSIVAYTVSF